MIDGGMEITFVFLSHLSNRERKLSTSALLRTVNWCAVQCPWSFFICNSMLSMPCSSHWSQAKQVKVGYRYPWKATPYPNNLPSKFFNRQSKISLFPLLSEHIKHTFSVLYTVNIVLCTICRQMSFSFEHLFFSQHQHKFINSTHQYQSANQYSTSQW